MKTKIKTKELVKVKDVAERVWRNILKFWNILIPADEFYEDLAHENLEYLI